MEAAKEQDLGWQIVGISCFAAGWWVYAACFVTCSYRKGSHAYLRDSTRNPRQPSGSFVWHQPRVLPFWHSYAEWGFCCSAVLFAGLELVRLE